MLSCLFVVLPLMGKAEWGGNPVWWWLGLYFSFVCCLDEAPTQGATVGYVMPGLVFKWFLLCEFSLSDTPYGLFSGSQRSLSQHSHFQRLKGWSLVRMKIPQVICYSINWDEQKYPKMKTKDKHQTNGSYKIKQIIIKTMEIHICIYTYKQKQQSNKNKVQ